MIFEHFQAYILNRRLRHAQSGLGSGSEEVRLARTLQAIPRQTQPAPHKRRAYLQHCTTPEVAHGLHLANLATRIAGATLALGVLTTSMFAWASKPGSTLYSYKNRTQDLRLMFVASESKQAAIRLSYVEDRLEATRTVLESDADSETKTAALTELTKQTEATVEAVQQVAVNQKDATLLDRLQTITEKQTAVITNTTDPAVQPAAQEALKTAEAGSKKIAAAKRLVAASSEAAVAKLSETTTLKGQVSKLGTDTFVLEKDSITITKETVISFDSSLNLPSTQKAILQNGQKVTIIATQNEDKTYTAVEITITTLSSGKVKGTTTPDEPTPTTPEEIERSIPEVPDPEPTTSTVQTGFLIENPAPVYKE